ncbi:MAG: sulfotransferase [Candidatus Thermoplasmatota archaeon]
MRKTAEKDKMPAQTGRFVKKKQKDEQYLEKIKDISYKPIFILGMHRSGTSILYKMLRSTNKFNSLTAYDVVYYDRLLLNKIKGKEEEYKKRLNNLIKKEGEENRDIDRIKMNADFAIEYSFLLGPPYLFQHLKPSTFQIFNQLCKKLQFIRGRNRPILLKNPWDFPNFLFIKKNIPEAKFIFIHRNPLDVLNSSVKALRVIVNKETVYSNILSPFAKRVNENPMLELIGKTLLTPYFPSGVMLITENRVKYAKRFLKNIKKLDDKSYINVKYEDLCEKTTVVMKKIFDHLNIEEKNIEKYNDFINPRDLSYSSDIERMKGYIMKRFKEYRDYFGYK